MVRQIVVIDGQRCNGCGLCVNACHEGAIGLVEGKARLLREDFCDGMGDCLPACPMNAISFEEREAPAYDAQAVAAARPGVAADPGHDASQLAQWPCQIRLVPPVAPYFAGARLLVAADCTAFACGDFHNRFMAGRVTVVGCPKLDPVDYSEKLAAILAGNDIAEVLLVRMDVPCCGGLERALAKAVALCGRDVPARVVTVGRTGRVLGEAPLV